MPRLRSTGFLRRALRPLPWALAAAGLLVFAPSDANAHFILKTPASWRTQDGNGSPQKAPPCGDDGDAPETGLITAFRTGDEVTITIEETIFHPGHYRVALAVNDRSELPDAPPVEPDDKSDCGSTTIQDPPVFPVLADGMLLHTQRLQGPQTITVKLPADVTCEKCTLQVIEFMSNHGLNNPGGCYYHHCANLAISDNPAGGSSGGQGGSPGGSTGGSAPSGGSGGSHEGGSHDGGTGGKAGGTGSPAAGDDDDGGCSYNADGGGGLTPGLAGLAGLFVTGALLRRRRRR
jgi:hypothetical protein